MIKINELTKEYYSGSERVLAVNNISLEIEDNEFLTIIGQSGSGKSTLLTILGGLSKPTSGSIIVDDLDIFTTCQFYAGTPGIDNLVVLKYNIFDRFSFFGIAFDDHNHRRVTAEST